MQLSKEGGTSLSPAKGVVCGSATPFVPQGVPPNLFKLFSRGPKGISLHDPNLTLNNS